MSAKEVARDNSALQWRSNAALHAQQGAFFNWGDRFKRWAMCAAQIGSGATMYSPGKGSNQGCA